MAETIVQITEGAGKKLHAWDRVIGANTVLDEVVLPGENYLPTYQVTHVTGTLLTTAASHNMQIMAGASLKVRIRRITVYQVALATAAAFANLAIYRLTTAGTGGTALTPSPLESTDAASGATAMTLPTAKGTEGALIDFASPYLMQTVAASSQLMQPIAVWNFDTIHSKPLIIPAGTSNGIAVKNIAAIPAAGVVIVVKFDESSF